MSDIESILQVRHRDARLASSQQKPLIVTNGIIEELESASSIDGPAITIESDVNQDRVASVNRCVEFEGDHYWLQDDYVYVRVPGSGWTVGVAPGRTAQGPAQGTTIVSTASDKFVQNLGLFPFVSNGGEQKLAVLYVDSETPARLGIQVKESNN